MPPMQFVSPVTGFAGSYGLAREHSPRGEHRYCLCTTHRFVAMTDESDSDTAVRLTVATLSAPVSGATAIAAVVFSPNLATANSFGIWNLQPCPSTSACKRKMSYPVYEEELSRVVQFKPDADPVFVSSNSHMPLILPKAGFEGMPLLISIPCALVPLPSSDRTLTVYRSTPTSSRCGAIT